MPKVTHIPSYKQGFARYAAESEAPGLWKNLRGLWVPALGPTGVTLHDWSGYRNNGTLTNMDPATDWVMTEKGWALDFDGSAGQRVALAVSSLYQPASKLSVAATVYLPSDAQPAFSGVVTVNNAGGSRGWMLLFEETTDQWRFYVYDGGWQFAAGSATKSAWASLVGTFDGTTVRVYVDGVLQPTTDTAGTIDYGTPTQASIGAYDTNEYIGKVTQASIYNRVLTPNEIQSHYTDPYAMLRRRRVNLAAAPAAGGVAPTGVFYGPLVGPFGGAI